MLPPAHLGSGAIPLLSVNNASAISFFLQSGLAKDSVTIETSDLNLKSLKDLACNFVDRKVREAAVNCGDGCRKAEVIRLACCSCCSDWIRRLTRSACSSLTMDSIA